MKIYKKTDEKSILELLENIGLGIEANCAEILDRKHASAMLPKRKRDSHKGSYGKAAIVAGSLEYTGAAYLSMTACVRAGAGYTTLFTPADILPYYILKTPEALLRPISKGSQMCFEERFFQALLEYDSIAYGMGMGVSEEVAKGAQYLLMHYTGKLVLDADGLNSLAKYFIKDLETLFCNKKCSVIITPHVKEFSRLCGKNIAEIKKESTLLPQKYAKQHNITVLLKNAVSVITDGTRIILNVAGNTGQAKGGSGDVLSGVLAGLCASGMSVFDGGCVAAFTVGTAAEIAAQTCGEYALTATDIIANIGGVFLEMEAPCTR